VEGRSDLEGPAIVLLGAVVGLQSRLHAPSPPKQPSADAALAVALAALPSLGESALKQVRSRVDELLAGREVGAKGFPNDGCQSESEQPPAKRAAAM